MANIVIITIIIPGCALVSKRVFPIRYDSINPKTPATIKEVM